jgi:hypothetical protein
VHSLLLQYGYGRPKEVIETVGGSPTVTIIHKLRDTAGSCGRISPATKARTASDAAISGTAAISARGRRSSYLVCCRVGGPMFGWHPIPSTALGCSLHKRSHSFGDFTAMFENSMLATDCFKVTIFGQEEIVRDAQKIAAARAWFDARSDLWTENLISLAGPPTPLLVPLHFTSIVRLLHVPG